jgi:hypothetical protein
MTFIDYLRLLNRAKGAVRWRTLYERGTAEQTTEWEKAEGEARDKQVGAIERMCGELPA